MTTTADLARIAREAREAREREAEFAAADAVTPPLTECLEPGCIRGPGEKGAGRGLCRRHYNVRHHAVRRGETTWEAEERAGRARPKREISRSPWRRGQA